MPWQVEVDILQIVGACTTDRWKDKNGDLQEKTEWHRVSLFKRLAEIAGEYLKKGSQVYIEGRLQTRKWTDKEGHDRYSTDIIANEMKMLGSRSGAGEPMDRENGRETTAAREPGPRAQAPAKKPGAV